MATTMVAAVILGDKLIVANVATAACLLAERWGGTPDHAGITRW